MKGATIHPRSSFSDSSGRIGRTIIASKMLAARNRLRVMRRRTPVLVGFQLGVVFPATIAFALLLTLGFAAATRGIDDEGGRSFLALLIACGCVGAFIGSSTTALQALFLADDVPFLLTLPIPMRALFGSKFVETAVGVVPASMIFLASIGGYGLVRSDRLLYWPVALLVAVGFLAAATSCAIIVVSLVSRYIPPRRARMFLLGISVAIMAVTLLAWGKISPQPSTLESSLPQQQLAHAWDLLVWTPVGLGAVALTEAKSGNLVVAAFALSGHLLVAVALVSFSFKVFCRTFFRGLAQTQAVQMASPNESVTFWLGRLAGLFPPRVGALVLKEWLLIIRDLRRLSGAMWPVGMVLMYMVLLGRGDNSSFGSPDLKFWSQNGSLALMPWGLSLGISVYSFGSEGRNIGLLRSIPLAPAKIFVSKVLASAGPVTLISLSVAAISLWLRDAPLASSLQLIGLIVWMIAGYVVIDTSAAALAPNFDTDQAQRTIGLAGRFYSFLVGGLFSLATLIGAARLILFTVDVPETLRGALQLEIGPIHPLGWPLVGVAAAGALLVVIAAAATAVRNTRLLLIDNR
jgi:Putative ATP-binding cassette